MVRKLLFIVLALGMSMCSVSRGAVVEDDFEDGILDTSQWQLLNGPGVSITEADGAVFFDRPALQLNYLVTADQFDPAAKPLTITGSVTLATDGDMDVWTRADLVANTGDGPAHVLDSGIRINFWQNAVDAGYPPNLDILEKRPGLYPWESLVSEGGIIPRDDEAIDWDFVITDDGTTITATFTQTSDPANTLTVTGTSTIDFVADYVAITVVNGYLNDIAIIPEGEGLELAAAAKPADGATDVPPDVVLGWTPGVYAVKHDVYFGTSFADVNAATTSDHPNVEVSLNQDANTYDPAAGLLEFGTIYYWRIDEVNAPPTLTVFRGEVWSFTTEAVAYPISGVTATASSSQDATTGPEKTVDGSGIDANDQHSTEVTDMWLSSATGPQPPWIKYDFGKSYRLHEMWVWNYNSSVEPFVGFGLKEVTIQYSTDSVNWTQLLGVPDFDQGTGLSDYTYNRPVNFGDVEARYVMITANSNWSGGLLRYGLSEVRFFSIPVHARKPDPGSGATDVPLDVTLTWRAGREAAEHKVYVSDDVQAVVDGTVDAETVTETSYSPPSLDLGKTYYWRVDEVNDSESPDTWEGNVWRFTTEQLLVVDDMESYNGLLPDDPDSNRIWRMWEDGAGYGSVKYPPIYCGNGTGSAVGDVSTDSKTEETIVHGGFQSMPYTYINDGTSMNICEDLIVEYYSEAELTFSPPQDWTEHGVKALSLWFYGDPANDANATEQLYLKINDTKVAYDGDLTDIQQAQWHEWNIDLTDFAVPLANVTTLAIGFGDEANTTPGGSGKVLFDDIRLYPARCVPSRLKPAGDLNDDCVVDYADIETLSEGWLLTDDIVATANPGTTNLVGHWMFDGNADDSSGQGYHGVVSGTARYVAGIDGQALEFDGSSTYVDVNDILVEGSFTIAAWIKYDTLGTFNALMHTDGWANGSVHVHLRSDTLLFNLDLNGGVGATATTVLEANEWYHVAGSVDTTAIVAKAYVNGALENTNTGTSTSTPNIDSLTIGAWDNNGTIERFVDGMIDDFRIYNRTLSDAEVAYLADLTPDDGSLYVPVPSPAELYEAEPEGSRLVDLKDYARLADTWLEELLWP